MKGWVLAVVLAIAGGASCQGATRHAAGEATMSGEGETRDARGARFLGQLPEGERSRALWDELVADWQREAGGDPDAAAIFEVLEDEAAAAFAGKTPKARLDWVHAEVLDRRLRVLSRRALAAARGLLDKSSDEARVRAEGEAILAEAERISPELKSVEAERAVSLRQALEDVVLEGLYLVERKAMSRRFQELFGGDAPAITD